MCYAAATKAEVTAVAGQGSFCYMTAVTAAVVGEVGRDDRTIRLTIEVGGPVAVVTRRSPRRCFQSADTVISMATLAVRSSASGNRIGISAGIGMATDRDTTTPRSCAGSAHVRSAWVWVGVAAGCRFEDAVHVQVLVDENSTVSSTAGAHISVAVAVRGRE